MCGLSPASSGAWRVQRVQLDLLNNRGRGAPSDYDRPNNKAAQWKPRNNSPPRREAAVAPRPPKPSPKGHYEHKQSEEESEEESEQEEEEEEPSVWWHEKEMQNLPPKRPHKPTVLGLVSDR